MSKCPYVYCPNAPMYVTAENIMSQFNAGLEVENGAFLPPKEPITEFINPMVHPSTKLDDIVGSKIVLVEEENMDGTQKDTFYKRSHQSDAFMPLSIYFLSLQKLESVRTELSKITGDPFNIHHILRNSQLSGSGINNGDAQIVSQDANFKDCYEKYKIAEGK